MHKAKRTSPGPLSVGQRVLKRRRQPCSGLAPWAAGLAPSNAGDVGFDAGVLKLPFRTC